MSTRFNLLADPRFEPLQGGLRERVRAAADALDAETFPDVFDSLMRGLLHSGFDAAGAHEGTLWLVDRAQENLVPVHNTGPNATDFVGRFSQPLNRGLISMVFATEQPFCENDVHLHEAQDRTIDQALGLVTCAMIAVPFHFALRLRGVVSCVQLKPAGERTDPPGFSGVSLRNVQLSTLALSRLLDHWLVGVTVGWEAE